MANGMIHTRAGFAADLWLYGEDELAVAVLDTHDETYQRIMVAAGDPEWLAVDPRASWPIEEIAALGAVQVLAGTARPLARKRPRPESALADLWRAAGRQQPDDLNDGMVEAIRLMHGIPNPE